MMGFGGTGMLLVILFWIALIAAAIWFVARLFPQAAGSTRPDTGQPGASALPAAEDILKQRYVRGEISKEQYEEMRRTIAA